MSLRTFHKHHSSLDGLKFKKYFSPSLHPKLANLSRFIIEKLNICIPSVILIERGYCGSLYRFFRLNIHLVGVFWIVWYSNICSFDLLNIDHYLSALMLKNQFGASVRPKRGQLSTLYFISKLEICIPSVIKIDRGRCVLVSHFATQNTFCRSSLDGLIFKYMYISFHDLGK